MHPATEAPFGYLMFSDLTPIRACLLDKVGKYLGLLPFYNPLLDKNTKSPS